MACYALLLAVLLAVLLGRDIGGPEKRRRGDAVASPVLLGLCVCITHPVDGLAYLLPCVVGMWYMVYVVYTSRKRDILASPWGGARGGAGHIA